MHRKPVRLIIRFKWNCLLGNLSHGWRKAFRACSPFCTKPFDRWHRICSSEMRIDYGLGAVEIILRWIIYRECIFTLSNSNTNKPIFMMTNQTCEFFSNVFHSMPYWQWKNQRIFRINLFPFFLLLLLLLLLLHLFKLLPVLCSVWLIHSLQICTVRVPLFNIYISITHTLKANIWKNTKTMNGWKAWKYMNV